MLYPPAVALWWFIILCCVLPTSVGNGLPEPFADFSKPGRRWPEEPCGGMPSTDGLAVSLDPEGSKIVTFRGGLLFVANTSALLDACGSVAGITLRPNVTRTHPNASSAPWGRRDKQSRFGVYSQLSLSNGGLALAIPGWIVLYRQEALGTRGRPYLQLPLRQVYSRAVALAELPTGGIVAAVSNFYKDSYVRVFTDSDLLYSSSYSDGAHGFVDLNTFTEITSMAVLKDGYITVGVGETGDGREGEIEVFSPGFTNCTRWYRGRSLVTYGRPLALVALRDGSLIVGTGWGTLQFFPRAKILSGERHSQKTAQVGARIVALAILPDDRLAVGCGLQVNLLNRRFRQVGRIDVGQEVSKLLFQPGIGLIVGTQSGSIDIFSEAALSNGGGASNLTIQALST